jgi:ParB family chromosome partitioning protein
MNKGYETTLPASSRFVLTMPFKRLKGQQLDYLYKDLLDLQLDADAYRAFAKSKKGEKNEAMPKLFNDPEHQKMCGVTAEQKARIEAWVPDCF